MKRFAIALLLALSCLHAQDGGLISRVFQLKYADADRVGGMLFGWEKLHADGPMKTIAIRATKSKLDEFEQIINRFDVPPPAIPNVEVTIYIMSALSQPSTSTVPPELERVVAQLRNMFSYKAYQLIDTQLIRVRAGQGGAARGVINSGSDRHDAKPVSRIAFRAASISNDEKGRAIRIDLLQVGLKVPVSGGPGKDFQYLDTGFGTDVDVREGQKVVVGKANMDGSDRASIVVLTAKVVD